MNGKHAIYEKCIKVLTSCKTSRQLEVAVNYVNIAAKNQSGFPQEYAFALIRCEAIMRYRLNPVGFSFN